MARRPDRAWRRGNYAVLVVFTIVTILTFGALAVDVSYVRLAQGQAQDVADAASQAGILVLRRTGDTALATQAAERVVALNPIVGRAGAMDSITFGLWDQESGTYTETDVNPNAVRVVVSRSGGNSVSLFLASMFGWSEADVRGAATSATRSLEAVLVMDITGSWSQANFRYARDAALMFFDTLKASHSEWDRLGMVIFTRCFAYEYSPFTDLESDTTAMRAAWAKLNVGSKGGVSPNAPDSNPYDTTECPAKGLGTVPSPGNVFTLGGCYPDMPREYRDEYGTDHSAGLHMARTMFRESTNPTAYKALVTLTDGQPNPFSNTLSQRAADGYTETRWREYIGPTSRASAAAIRTASIAITDDLWTTDRVHSWVVSFVQHDEMMPAMVNGDGYYELTTSASALVPIFEDIANSMPLAIVQ